MCRRYISAKKIFTAACGMNFTSFPSLRKQYSHAHGLLSRNKRERIHTLESSNTRHGSRCPLRILRSIIQAIVFVSYSFTPFCGRRYIAACIVSILHPSRFNLKKWLILLTNFLLSSKRHCLVHQPLVLMPVIPFLLFSLMLHLNRPKPQPQTRPS